VKLIVTLRDASIGEDVRSYARERAGRLQHYFERITSVEVILSETTNHTHRKRAEFIVHAPRAAALVAQAEDTEARAAIDRAQAEARRLVLRHKEMLTDHRRGRRESAKRRERAG
jgi:ribosomal subunit interface protein